MIETIDIRIPASFIEDLTEIKKLLAKQLSILTNDIVNFRILKKSVDARQKQVFFQCKILVGINEIVPEFEAIPFTTPTLSTQQSVAIIGAGPAGLFAALELLKLGIQPLIFERGKDVKARRRDLAAINQKQIVNPESNYCFGEGGAGTYSDGKLYTRSNKRGDVNDILNTLVFFGADAQITVDAHPHIGTNKLPKIIENIRNFIIEKGGKVYFEHKLSDILIEDNQIKGITINHDKQFWVNEVILATGHSARDIFELLHKKNILIEAKEFALGVRVEHPQSLIDQQQYHCTTKPNYLPPANYSLVSQKASKAVFSFCMCPGGIIAPCATAPGEIVTNGWSPSKRNNPYANSGIVAAINANDWEPFKTQGPLAALAYQKSVEQMAYKFGGGGQVAPAQRLLDFVENKLSNNLPKTSYQPGINAVITDEVLPKNIAQALRIAFVDFGKKIPHFISNEAVIHLTESRTSSPVRIPRIPTTLQHPNIKGLYPCGEGAGYAGGIMSAAIDGIKCAQKIHSEKKESYN